MQRRGGAWSIEVEAFLHGGSEQPLPHDVLGGIFRELQVVDAGVDRWVAGVCGVHLRGNACLKWRPGDADGGFYRGGRGGLTFLTIVRRGCKLARPPGGSVEQPVVNCRKAFLSSDDIPHRTLTNRRKPGLRSRTERRHQRRVLFNNPEGEEPLGRSASSHQGALVALKSWGVRVPVSGVTQLWLSVVNDVIGCPRR